MLLEFFSKFLVFWKLQQKKKRGKILTLKISETSFSIFVIVSRHSENTCQQF